MDSLPGLGKVPRSLLLDELLGLFRYPPGLGVHCLLALFPFRIVLLGLPAGPPQLLVQTVPGYQSVMEAFGKKNPLLRALCRAIRTWKSGLRLCPRCLGVASAVRRIRDACFAFYERLLANFTYFLRVVNSDPRRLLSIPQNGEVCTVDASCCSVSSRASHFESGHYFYELSM